MQAQTLNNLIKAYVIAELSAFACTSVITTYLTLFRCLLSKSNFLKIIYFFWNYDSSLGAKDFLTTNILW